MAIKTGLEGKPWYYAAAAGLVLAGGLFFLGHWQYIQPLKDEIERQETKLAELHQKIQEGRSAKMELPKFREEVRQLELELDKLLRILPARRNTPDLLRRIRALAEQGDFALKRFTPAQQLVDKEFFSEWTIAVDVDGTYHNLALLFDRIGRFSRIINIEDLNITAISVKGNPHTITATFNAKTFVYKETEPGAPSAG
ncbi:MAG: type 4a pilus biogenesis protein PilO, partial [Acidobacteriota bacterium]|nr:type 4a pilus biogenesis protein PilO [Acidobacteriota bacterium]